MIHQGDFIAFVIWDKNHLTQKSDGPLVEHARCMYNDRSDTNVIVR